MLLAVAKITLSVVAVMAIALLLAYLLRKFYQRSSTPLFADGYILTHPKRPAVAFNSAQKANEFAKRARQQGVIFNVHALFNGKLVHCGSTQNMIIG